jgi:hypothetical protein
MAQSRTLCIGLDVYEEARQGPASRDRGRPPTDTRQVGAYPRIAAGASVVFSWPRLVRCPEEQQTS